MYAEHRKNLMEITRPRRQHLIWSGNEQLKSSTDILNRWPAFRALPWTLIEAEFIYIAEHQTKRPIDSLGAKWEKMAPIILKECIGRKLDGDQLEILKSLGLVNLNDLSSMPKEAQYIAAFLMLPWLFRASCGRARKRLNADEPKTSSGGRLSPSTIKNYLICFVEERMSQEEAIQKSKNDGKILQPLILAKTRDGRESIPTELFVVVDHDSFPVEGNFTQAIRLLFMCYWVFGIEYPTEVNLCYYFLENLFEMHGFKPLSPMAKKHKGLNSQSTQLCNQLMELYDDADEVLL